MKKLRDIVALITKYVSWVALAATFAMMVITTVDVILRKIPFIPLSIKGSYDMTEMFMVVIVFLGIAFMQSEHGHVRVDMFVDKLPYRGRSAFEGVILLVETVFCCMMTYAGFTQVARALSRGTGTGVLRIPHWPFTIIMSIGLMLFTILLCLDGLILIGNAIKGKAEDGGTATV